MHLTSSVPLLGLLSAIPLVLSIPTQIPHTLTRRDQFDGQPANLIITTYNAANCPTGTGQNTSITYGKQVLANTWSYTLNRDVQDGEQLDFSVYTPGQGNINGVSTACTQFAETTSPDPKTNGNLLADTCYGIGNEANVSSESLRLLLRFLMNDFWCSAWSSRTLVRRRPQRPLHPQCHLHRPRPRHLHLPGQTRIVATYLTNFFSTSSKSVVKISTPRKSIPMDQA